MNNFEYQDDPVSSPAVNEDSFEVISDDSSDTPDNSYNEDYYKNILMNDEEIDLRIESVELSFENLQEIMNDDPLYDISDEEDNIDDTVIDNLDLNSIESGFVYSGCNMTTDKAVLELMTIHLEKKFTKSTLNCFIKLIQKLLPDCNQMPKTIYKLFEYIKQKAPPETLIKHYYCEQCRKYKETENRALICSACEKTERTKFFYELDISNQIKYLFEHRNLSSKLIPFNDPQNENIISDIRDGSEYKRVNSRPDRNLYDLTLILNTDDLSLVKSSKSNC
ncbi:uncharacterized protein LOC122849115 isoform X2 [Aphidius gifuensis]|nr:uncharacterized protein LOC122849115 isoform X2 [Aphidius gifuensis]